MSDDTSNKRAMPRFPLQVPVTVKKDAAVIESKTRDVSASGVFVYLPSAMQEGDQIEFNITLPQELTMTGAIQVTCKGRIVRVTQADNGQVGVAATIDSYVFGGRSDEEQSTAANA